MGSQLATRRLDRSTCRLIGCAQPRTPRGIMRASPASNAGEWWPSRPVMTIHLSPFSNLRPRPVGTARPTLWSGPSSAPMPPSRVPLFFQCAELLAAPPLAAGHLLTVALRYCPTCWGSGWLGACSTCWIPFNLLAAGERGLPARHGEPVADAAARGSAQRLVGGRHDPPLVPARLMDGGGADPGLCQQVRLPRLALLLGPCSTAWPLIGGSWRPAAAGGEWALLTRNGPSSPCCSWRLAPSCACVPGSRTPGAAPDDDGGDGALRPGGRKGLLRVAAVPLARHDFLLGSLPWALGLFGLLLANPVGQGSWLERQAPRCSASTVCT